MERWIRESGKVRRHLLEKIMSQNFESESESALRMSIAVVKIQKTSPEKKFGENFAALASRIIEKSLFNFDEKVKKNLNVFKSSSYFLFLF